MVNDGLLGLLGLQLEVTSKEEEWKGRMGDWKEKKRLEGGIQNRIGGSKWDERRAWDSWREGGELYFQ